VGAMRDPEVEWIPEKAVEAGSVRAGAIVAAVIAITGILIGIVIGRLTTSIPAGTVSKPLDMVSAPSAMNPSEREVQRPSLALKSDTEATTAGPGPQTEPRPNPPVIFHNPGTTDKDPGTADKESTPAPEQARARARSVRQPSLLGEPQQNSEHQATRVSPPARNYQNLREYMLNR